MPTSYKWTLRFTLWTVPILFFVVLLMGGGHGSYVPAILIFPFALLSFPLFDELTIPFAILGILQYPIYGFLIDRIIMANQRQWPILLICIVHIMLAIVILLLTADKR